jgi:hypothetical protein
MTSKHDVRQAPVTVRFAFTPAAAYVRAARLVAADVASHAGVDSGLLDEVRQAVGEACTRAVLRHRVAQLDDLVRVEFSIGDRFVAKVTDNARQMSAMSSTGHASAHISPCGRRVVMCRVAVTRRNKARCQAAAPFRSQ